MYIWFKYQQIFSEELKRCLIRKMPQLNCLLTRGTTINFFQNKTIEEDEKCQHIFKHTVVRNRFLCVMINSTIYLRGIYRKIFFNLAEFLVRIWPLVLLLGMMRDRRRTETSSRKQRHSLRQRHFYVEHGARPRARAKCHFSHKYFSRL